jgi:hypothetical protein
MDLTAGNSVIGTELDSPAAKHTGNIIEDGNNSNYNNTSSSSSNCSTIVNQQQDLFNCNNQIYNIQQQKEDIVLLNSITS